MARREFLTRLSQIAALPFLAAGVLQAQAQPSKKSLKIMMKSAWGSDDPTKAAFPFSHGLALSEAGHEVQIFLLGEAVSLMRKAVANFLLDAFDGVLGAEPAGEAERRQAFVSANLMAGAVGIVLWPLHWALFLSLIHI